MSKHVKPRCLLLMVKDIELIKDWFMFVEPPQRTKIDLRIYSRLLSILSKKDECFNLNKTESQIIIRWYFMIPEVIRDNTDERVYSLLETFITKE